MEIGIIGLANVGKSTLFNALTKAKVPALNYPFCTIEPNIGVVMVPDQRLLEVAAVTQPEKLTGATIKFVDIAGLVKGASKGEGLGNQFLAHIRQVDAVIHLVRCFSDPNVARVNPEALDPVMDMEIVETELALADLQVLERRIEKTQRLLKTGIRKHQEDLAKLEQAYAALNQGSLASLDLPDDLPMLTTKPMLYVLNVDEEAVGAPELIEQQLSLVSRAAAVNGRKVLVICAALEDELSGLPPPEAAEFMAAYGLQESGLTKIIAAGAQLLDLITFYTVKGPETRAWLIPRGTRAPQAAGQIHTDMERGFIKAEVISGPDLAAFGSFARAKEEGLMRLEGKEYPIQDGDVVLFHFNV